MKVKIIKAKKVAVCRCARWLEHWQEFGGGSMPTFCPEITCTKPPEIGVHVQKEDPADPGWYIIPLCKLHSGAAGKTIEIFSKTKFVPAAAIDTCGSPEFQKRTPRQDPK